MTSKIKPQIAVFIAFCVTNPWNIKYCQSPVMAIEMKILSNKQSFNIVDNCLSSNFCLDFVRITPYCSNDSHT